MITDNDNNPSVSPDIDAVPSNVAGRRLAPLQVPAGQDHLHSEKCLDHPNIPPGPIIWVSAHLGPALRQAPGRLLANPRVGTSHYGHTPCEVHLVIRVIKGHYRSL